MNAARKTQRYPYRRKVYYGENGEVIIAASGELGLAYARIYAPPAGVIRAMLLQLRRAQGWSQATLAAVLGVPKHSLRRWEDGSRNPCGSAKKLIWIVHTLFLHPKELLMDLDNIVTWGHGSRKILMLDEDDATGKP